MAGDLRTVAAVVLGTGLGLLLLARPGFVIRVQTAGRLPRDRGGQYGADAPTARPVRTARPNRGQGENVTGRNGTEREGSRRSPRRAHSLPSVDCSS